MRTETRKISGRSPTLPHGGLLPHHQQQTLMKTTTLLISLLPLLLATTGRALDAFPQDAKPADAPAFTIAERGPHNRLWTNSAGGTYTELANGLHYLDQNGNSAETSDEIQIGNGHDMPYQGQ